MALSLAEVRHMVAMANRICAHEGVVDAFGHVSIRHPDNPNHYFLSRSRSPELVEASDIYEFNLDSEPVVTPKEAMYSERVIHGEIYKARPDVNAVCHHHAPAIMPYVIAAEKLVPVFHLGSVIGLDPPFWDQQDEFGDTNLLVRFPEEGASLARALGKNPMVLMNRHGATVVGGDLRQLVFRTIYSVRNAEYQTAAKLIGKVNTLTPGEVEHASKIQTQPNAISRAWEYWVARLEKHEGKPARGKTTSVVAASARKKAVRAAKKKSGKGKRR